MYYENLSSQDLTIISSLFALAWFIVGILVGRELPSRRARSGSASTRTRSKSDDDAVELYVGNLSYDMTEKDLLKVFEPFGRVVSVRLIKNKFNDKSKGFGFIEMASQSESSAAVRALNGKDLKGRKAVVNEAKSQARN